MIARRPRYHQQASQPSFPPSLPPCLPPCLPACLRCSGCEAVLCGIEEQVTRANQYRESQLKVKVQVETEVSKNFFSLPSGMFL